MTDRDVTLTDILLAALCAGFALALALAGRGGIALPSAALFAALAVASAAGGLWHGWFKDVQRGAGGALWRLTLVAIGAANLALWLIAARMLGLPLLGWIGAGQFALYLAGLAVTRSFLWASAHSLPPTLALAWAQAAGLAAGGPARLWLGLAGIGLALGAAGLQARGVAAPALRLSRNGLYHLLQALAFTLLFLGLPA